MSGPIFGPWYANEQEGHWSVHASDPDAPPLGNLVCKLPLDDQGAARACLIAAGPEMLETLYQYVSDLRFPPVGDSIDRRIARAEAVIAKARGEA